MNITWTLTCLMSFRNSTLCCSAFGSSNHSRVPEMAGKREYGEKIIFCINTKQDWNRLE